MSKLVRSWWLLVIPAGVALGVVTTYVATFHHLPATENPGAWGTFGDYFGGLLNPLISALTLFVAIRVWQLQKQELAETRKAMEEQAKTAEQQRQEQRFFDLLNVYQRTVDSISHTQGKSAGGDTRELLTSSGKQAISTWLTYVTLTKTALAAFDPLLSENTIERHWVKHGAPGRFDHYFRVVFRILSEAEALLGDQHIRYIKLFRAQLSQSELIILAYNLWVDEEGRKMIPLAAKYGLLKHLPKGHLRATLEQELPPLIFGRTRATELAATSPAPSIEETT